MKYIFIWYVFGILRLDNILYKFGQSRWSLTFEETSAKLIQFKENVIICVMCKNI